MSLMLVPLDEDEALQLAEWAAKQEDIPLPRFFERLAEVAAELKAYPAGRVPQVVASEGLWKVIMATAIMRGVPAVKVVEPSGKNHG
jgi:hypothetical protein